MADDHRRTHVDEPRYPLAQQLSDLVPRAQVLRGVLARRPEPAEVDDALDAGVARGLAEVHGRLAVAARRSRRRSRGPSSGSGSRRCGSRRAPSRRPRPLTASPPRTSTLRRLARARRDRGRARARARPRRSSSVDQEAADVAGGAGDEHGIGFAVLGHRARYVPKQVPDSIHAAALPVDGCVLGEETLDVMSKED